MNELTADTQPTGIVELNVDEIDEVSGGIAPLAYAAIAVGLHLVAVGLAVRDIESRK